jgi:hypothetical protein
VKIKRFTAKDISTILDILQYPYDMTCMTLTEFSKAKLACYEKAYGAMAPFKESMVKIQWESVVLATNGNELALTKFRTYSRTSCTPELYREAASRPV